MNKQTDDTATEIGNLLIGIAHIGQSACYLLARLSFKETEQQLLSLGLRKELQTMCILNVHDLIADIVGCFYQKDKRMACELMQFGVNLYDTKFLCQLVERLGLRLEVSKLRFFGRRGRRIRVFDDGCQC